MYSIVFFLRNWTGKHKEAQSNLFLPIYKILNLFSFSGFALIIVILITGIFSFIQVYLFIYRSHGKICQVFANYSCVQLWYFKLKQYLSDCLTEFHFKLGKSLTGNALLNSYLPGSIGISSAPWLALFQGYVNNIFVFSFHSFFCVRACP